MIYFIIILIFYIIITSIVIIILFIFVIVIIIVIAIVIVIFIGIVSVNDIVIIISKVNTTEWGPIRSVIMRVITKSDDHAAGVRFVYHEYDHRPNWARRSGVTKFSKKLQFPRIKE